MAEDLEKSKNEEEDFVAPETNSDESEKFDKKLAQAGIDLGEDYSDIKHTVGGNIVGYDENLVIDHQGKAKLHQRSFMREGGKNGFRHMLLPGDPAYVAKTLEIKPEELIDHGVIEKLNTRKELVLKRIEDQHKTMKELEEFLSYIEYVKQKIQSEK